VTPSEHEAQYDAARTHRQKHVDAVVNATARKKLVVAGPGTGKTYLFKTVLAGKHSTLTLTFVNALVEDLSLELFGLSDVKTLHGFARQQLERAKHGTVRVFSKLSKVIRQDAVILLGEDIDFDRLFHNRTADDTRLTFYRTRRQYYDHYGFSDLIYAVVLYFEKRPDKIPAYSQVVVDEFQDFNSLEVSLIDLLATRSPVLLAGDDDQALYESLKDASPRHIRQRHCGAVDNYTCFSLPFCSRCTQVIVEAANDVIAKAKRYGLLQSRIEKPFRYFHDSKKDKDSDANPHIVHSQVYAKQIPWFIQAQIKVITGAVRAPYSVLILSPTRHQCRSICDALTERGFQNVHFTDKTESSDPLLFDGLKLLLEDATSTLGWRIAAKALLAPTDFDALLQSSSRPEETRPLAEMVEPVLRRQVRGMLTSLRKVRDGKSRADDKGLVDLLGAIGIDANGVAAERIRGELDSSAHRAVEPGIRRTPIVVTTIQSSKGLAADYVFITHVDDRFCVRDQEKGLSDQDVCAFMVALTRARRRVFLLSTDRTKTATFVNWIDQGRLCELPPPGASDA